MSWVDQDSGTSALVLTWEDDGYGRYAKQHETRHYGTPRSQIVHRDQGVGSKPDHANSSVSNDATKDTHHRHSHSCETLAIGRRGDSAADGVI